MVASIRSAGDMKTLWPKGVKRMSQVPWYLHEAIQHALHVLSWFENYQEKEIPDENIWDDPQGLELHWKSIKRKREDERTGVTEAKDDTEPGSGDMMDNAYASAFKK